MANSISTARSEPQRTSARRQAYQEVVLAAVRDVIAVRLGVPWRRVTANAHLTDHLGASSLAMVELALALEEWFDIDLPDEAVERARTVGDTVDCVRRALRRRSALGVRRADLAHLERRILVGGVYASSDRAHDEPSAIEQAAAACDDGAR